MGCRLLVAAAQTALAVLSCGWDSGALQLRPAAHDRLGHGLRLVTRCCAAIAAVRGDARGGDGAAGVAARRGHVPHGVHARRMGDDADLPVVRPRWCTAGVPHPRQTERVCRRPFLAAPWRWGIEGHADECSCCSVAGCCGRCAGITSGWPSWRSDRHRGKPTAAVCSSAFHDQPTRRRWWLVGAADLGIPARGPARLPHGRRWHQRCVPELTARLARSHRLRVVPCLGATRQLLGGALLCWWCSRRATFVVGVLAAFTFRALLEPGAWPIYSTAVIAAAILVDARRGRGPMLAAVAFGSWIATAWFFPMNLTEGALRNAALLVLVGVAVALSGGSRERSVDVAAPPTLRRTGEAVDAGMART